MDKIVCEISDLDEKTSFESLRQSLGATISDDSIQFDNETLSGEIISNKLNDDISVSKWKCTAHRSILLRRIGKRKGDSKKFNLFYFLQPATCHLSTYNKKIRIKRSRNNIFLSVPSSIDFNLLPKQPFYLFEISFNASWLMQQFNNAAVEMKAALIDYIQESSNDIFVEPFTVEEYRILHELEICLTGGNQHDFFVLSRIYNLVMQFFSKIVDRRSSRVIHSGVHYDQIILAESAILEEIRKPPSIGSIAAKVNMSVPSLIRKFRLIYGKGIHEYYVCKKMELAKKMVLEHGLQVKEVADILGYNQPSAFIEAFTKEFGHPPGQLRVMSKKFSFF